MSDVIVNNQAILPKTLIKIKSGQEQNAIAAAKKNGLDDVFFKVGNDTFVASGTGLPLRGAKPGATVYLDGKKGQVVATDRQLNTFAEGFKNPAGAAVAVAGLAYGAFTFATSLGVWKGLGAVYAVAGLVGGAVVNAFPATFAAFRKKDENALKPFEA